MTPPPNPRCLREAGGWKDTSDKYSEYSEVYFQNRAFQFFCIPSN